MENTTEFLRLLKHQIKGPLTIIKGYLSFWESEAYAKFPPEKQREFILKAMEGTKKMEIAIEDTFNKLGNILEEKKPNVPQNDRPFK